MKKLTILVFANLKPSQVNYKILPLSRSEHVERVIILRKDLMEIKHNKIICLSLPGIIKIRPFYWFLTAFYGIYIINRYKVSMILNYNILPHGFNAYIASLFTRKPVIFAEINEDTVCYHKKKITKPLIKAILRNASYITVPGSKIEKYWNLNGFPKTFKLHSTIEPNYFISEKTATKFYDFIYVGEFDKNKRPGIILEAFSGIRDMGINASICFIGFGKMEKHLKKLIAENNLDSYVSIVKSNNVKEYLVGSKILVMASLSEGIPCTMLEAMACELIVVVPPAGDIEDVVNHCFNGFVHNNTKEDIIKWMAYSYLNFDSLGNMRERARATIINEYSYQFAVNRWDKLLAELK